MQVHRWTRAYTLRMHAFLWLTRSPPYERTGWDVSSLRPLQAHGPGFRVRHFRKFPYIYGLYWVSAQRYTEDDTLLFYTRSWTLLSGAVCLLTSTGPPSPAITGLRLLCLATSVHTLLRQSPISRQDHTTMYISNQASSPTAAGKA